MHLVLEPYIYAVLLYIGEIVVMRKLTTRFPRIFRKWKTLCIAEASTAQSAAANGPGISTQARRSSL